MAFFIFFGGVWPGEKVFLRFFFPGVWFRVHKRGKSGRKYTPQKTRLSKTTKLHENPENWDFSKIPNFPKNPQNRDLRTLTPESEKIGPKHEFGLERAGTGSCGGWCVIWRIRGLDRFGRVWPRLAWRIGDLGDVPDPGRGGGRDPAEGSGCWPWGLLTVPLSGGACALVCRGR